LSEKKSQKQNQEPRTAEDTEARLENLQQRMKVDENLREKRGFSKLLIRRKRFCNKTKSNTKTQVTEGSRRAQKVTHGDS